MAIARLDTGGESAKKMMQHRCNFRTDTEAVSEVIGMVLLLAILVTFFTIIQVSVVPQWNKQVETDSEQYHGAYTRDARVWDRTELGFLLVGSPSFRKHLQVYDVFILMCK